ncbi:hypothetical protein [Opitutus sp. ER46]|uniref:hypothetical protein n=1 Tax=Opitutus sp. ER46 TaxID=2161864 RepID=UPI000D3019FA|nr:hypothetical protein [Opitutus sp. ER46]PTX94347.1 hypothetical protein DB354_11355 [Opitutus sp. ER46]
MPTSVDTKNASAVSRAVEAAFAKMYSGAGLTLVPAVFREVERLFAGGHPDFRAIDLRYHDLEHTLQATLCVVDILAGRHRAAVQPPISARQFELAVVAVLLHDAGYVKQRSDAAGTGAKYTYCHVLRSAAFAASYLPTLGVDDLELEGVLNAINCTGPAGQVSRLCFANPLERFIGCAVATGDYLGQMAAPDYPDELEILFHEFEESDNFVRVPPERRVFQSAADLAEKTPTFWRDVVRPKLESEFDAVYRFLAQPYPDGPNRYLIAIERNLAVIRQRSLRPDN